MTLNKTAAQLAITAKEILVIAETGLNEDTFRDVLHGISEVQRGEVTGFDIAYDAIAKSTKDQKGLLFVIKDIIKVIEDNIEY